MEELTQTSQITQKPSKPRTSWVAIFLLCFFLALGLVAGWFYITNIVTYPQPNIPNFSFDAQVEEIIEFEDIRNTRFEHSTDNLSNDDLKALGYVFSRDHTFQMSLLSGTGTSLVMTDEHMKEVIEKVDSNGYYAIPENFHTLKTVYEEQYANYHAVPKWDDISTTDLTRPNDRLLTSDEALGWLILLETEWAKHLQNEKYFGTSEDAEYAQYRAYGAIMLESAKEQALYWPEHPYKTTTIGGQYVLAAAMANLNETLTEERLTGVSEGNPFYDPETAEELNMRARNLLAYAHDPVTARELAIATTMLGMYGSIDEEYQDEIIKKFNLWEEQLNIIETHTIADKAWMVSAHIELGKRLNKPEITDRGWEIYEKLKREFITSEGLFRDEYFYTAEDVAAILQMLNRINEAGGKYWDQKEIEKFKLVVFENFVINGKIQRSYYPEEYFPVPEHMFEEWSYPSKLDPAPTAGGQYGKAPITGHKTWYRDGKWILYDDKYIASEGLYFAYVMQTLSSDYFSDVKNWKIVRKSTSNE